MSDWQLTHLSPSMRRAFADLKRGPLRRCQRAFIGETGERHHTGAVDGLARRYLAIVQTDGKRREIAKLSAIGKALRLEES